MQENDSHGPPQPPGARQAPPNSGPATMRERLSNLSYTNAMLTVIAACLLVLTFLAVNVTRIKFAKPGYAYVSVSERYPDVSCGGVRDPCQVEVIN